MTALHAAPRYCFAFGGRFLEQIVGFPRVKLEIVEELIVNSGKNGLFIS